MEFKPGDRVVTFWPETAGKMPGDLRPLLGKTYIIEKKVDSDWYLAVEGIYIQKDCMRLMKKDTSAGCICDIQMLLSQGCQCGGS